MSTKPRSPTSDAPASIWQSLLLFAAIALTVFAVSRFVFLRPDRSAGATHSAVGKLAPDVTFSALTNDQPLSLEALRGKVLLVNFWGTWCPPCRAEFPKLVGATKPYLSRDDFQMVSVCVPGGTETQKELAAEASEFLKRHKASFPAVADLDGSAFSELISASGVSRAGIPFTVIIDREGRFSGVWIGYEAGDEEEVARVLGATLENNTAN
jgi:cytochrome c biogenesis protein CcmG/thiol:disulfide interchange protein DsbE